jgi:ribonuclease J
MYLTIHRGSKQVGGSCVEVSTDSTRIIIDAGLPLEGADKDKLPRVPGLFSDGEPVHAIFLSHAHADHSGLLKQTRREIPVYLSQGTSKMMMAGALYAGQPGLDRGRQRILKHGEPFSIGDITITPFAVDHSAFDSMAFLVESGGKRLVYSGDLRLHGRKPGMAQSLIKAVTASPVNALVMEGTHFSSNRVRDHGEKELEKEILLQIKGAPSLVLASFSPMHIDRFVTFYRAAKRSGRTLVMDVYGAFVLHLASGQAKIPRPSASEGIRVYFNRRRRKNAKIEGKFLEDRIELSEILARPQRYVMLFRPSMLDDDFAGELPAKSRCIYSYWGGYLDKPDWRDFQSKLTELGGTFPAAHSSGHIFADDIVKFVNAINPKKVIPIHTFTPEAFSGHFKNVALLRDGEKCPVE